MLIWYRSKEQKEKVNTLCTKNDSHTLAFDNFEYVDDNKLPQREGRNGVGDPFWSYE